MKKTLTNKELLFCAYVRAGLTPREAAAKSGYTFAEKASLSLMTRAEIRREIKNSRFSCEDADCTLAGYKRLAYGCNSDAFWLLFCEEPTKKEIEKMDLFGVSEIKRPKGGGLEIKFFDRFKALEKLEKQNEKENSGAVSFYEAIEKSAEAISAP